MRNPRSSRREGVPFVVLVLAGSLALVLLLPGDARFTAPNATPGVPAITRVTTASAPSAFAPSGGSASPQLPPPSIAGNPPSGMYPIDLARMQRLLPGNSFWHLDDPRTKGVAEQVRVDDEVRRNALRGKVVSNTASEGEILEYFDERRRISEDYVAFSQAVLAEYGAELPERDQALYRLGISMHRTRIAETDRQIEEALARKQIQDEKRADYQRAKSR